MGKLRIWAVAAIGIIVLASMLLLWRGSTQTSAVEATVGPAGLGSVAKDVHPEADFPATSMLAEGLAAIPPHAGAQLGQPAFGVADVMAYLKVKPFRYGAAGKPAPSVTSIDFLTGQDVRRRVAGSVAVADDQLICLVTFSGDFVVQTNPDAKPYTGTTGYLAFDAMTGNVLFESVHP